MKRSFILSIILVFIVTSAWAVGTVHNFTTGVMHDAADISTASPIAGTVQNRMESLEVAVGTTLPTTYATKAYVNTTDESIIATAANLALNAYNHMGLTSAHGIDTTEIAASKYNLYNHIYTSGSTVHGIDTTAIVLQSGGTASVNVNGTVTSAIQANDSLRANNATDHINDTADAHAGTAITNTPAGSVAATTTQAAVNELDTEKAALAGAAFTGTVSNTAATTSAVGNIPFLLDPTNCSYFTRFQGNMNDIVNGTYPTYNSSLLKYYQDQFVSDSTTKGTVTNTGFTLTQYEGDAGKYGYGAAFEEARTNELTFTDDLTNGAWTKTNCTVALARVLPDGRKLFSITASADGSTAVYQNITYSAATYTASAFFINTTGHGMTINENVVNFVNDDSNTYSALTRVMGTSVVGAGARVCNFVLYGAHAGDVYYMTSPQLEAGSFATSYSASTSAGTSITRSATFAELPVSAVNPSVGSVAFWVKPRFTTNATDNLATFWGVGTAGATTNEIDIYYDATANGFVFGQTGASGSFNSLSSAAPAGFYTGWTHIAYTWSDATFTCYVNGVSVGVVSGAVALSTFSATAKHWLGAYWSTGATYGNFIMSDLAILKIALTAEQVKQIYSGGFRVNAPVVSGEVPNYYSGYAALANSYADVTGHNVMFQKAGDKVYLRGGLVTGASAATALTLPTSYRPATTAEIGVTAIGITALPNYAIIGGDGTIVPTYGGTGTLTDFSLDGIVFEAAQ